MNFTVDGDVGNVAKTRYFIRQNFILQIRRQANRTIGERGTSIEKRIKVPLFQKKSAETAECGTEI